MPMINLAVTVSEPVIVVFIHGFKGTDTTFGEFPQRLRHILTETIPNISVECIVFPAYETKGDLTEAVVKFADWLTTLTVEKEVASGGGAGKAKIVLCGHSMGGLLAADTLREFLKGRDTQQDFVLWPNIKAIIAFDTPYLGLHPGVFKNSATKAVEYAQAARNVGTGLFGALAGAGFGASKSATSPASTPPAAGAAASGWGKWAGTASYAVGGALLAGAAAGATYYKRDDLGLVSTWATDHMKYVGHLWNADSLNKRVDFLVTAEEKEGVLFRNFYTYLPPTPLLHNSVRTFIVLPKKNAPAEPYFVLARNGLASDEVEAHTGMFSGKTNDGYYDLGLQAAEVIREAIMRGRGIASVETQSSVWDDPEPSVPVDTTEPSVPVETTEPSVPVDTTEPSVLVDTAEPSVPGARGTPSVETKSSVWDDPEPSVLVDTAEPSAPVATTEPSVPVEAQTQPAKPSQPFPELSEWGKEWQ